MAEREIVTVHAEPGLEFKTVLAALKLQDETLPGKFKRKLRAVAKVGIAKVKAAALAIPTTGREHSGLRVRVARGVRLKINRAGDSVRVVTTMPNRDEAVIPRGLDSPHGWYHPVFGNMDEMVLQSQPGDDSWFRGPLAEERDSFADGFTDVLEDARDMIADAGE